jgi:hypothetical protein
MRNSSSFAKFGEFNACWGQESSADSRPPAPPHDQIIRQVRNKNFTDAKIISHRKKQNTSN